MLNLSRRHSLSKCKGSKRRSCTCPIWASGSLHGKKVRKALGIRNWESAQKIVREWEGRLEGGTVSLKEAFERFITACHVKNLSPETIYKYDSLGKEMVARFGIRSVDAIGISELSEYREAWKLGPNTARNKIELMRRFFSFCLKMGWVPKNPAKDLELPKNNAIPTLPVEDADFEKLVSACEFFKNGGIYGVQTGPRVKAFILLLRYSGLRIRDAAILKRSSIQGDKLFLYSHKTHVPVWIPLPEHVLEALEPFTGEYPFWSGVGTPKSAVAAWERSLKTLGKYAGIKFHAHQFRDSFAVGLLQSGVSLETVSVLLGNSIRVCERHYNPWVKSRQDNLAREIERAWKLARR